jgi:hypothetical protein
MIEGRDLNQADWMFERIIRTLKDFEESLTADQEVGLRFAALPGEVLGIENVGFWNPDMIKFYGRTGDGHRYELVQHTSQISLLLVALPKQNKEPRRIGFNLAEQLEKTRRSAAT